MRKQLFFSMVLVFLVTVGSTAVNAQSSISLQLASASTLSFAAGTSPVLTIGATAGAAGGTDLLAGATSYSLMGAGPVTITRVSGNQYSATGTIDITVFAGATDLLSGTLTFVDFIQHGKTGVMNLGLEENLDITGGTYCSDPGVTCGANAGFGTLTIGFPNGNPITHGVTGRLFTGTIMPNSISPTPEITSMLLFGTGLIAMGAMIRRRQKAA